MRLPPERETGLKHEGEEELRFLELEEEQHQAVPLLPWVALADKVIAHIRC